MHEASIQRGISDGFSRLVPGGIRVPCGEIDFFRHLKIVDAVIEIHHVRADLGVRRDFADAVALPLHEVDRLIGDKALPVELQAVHRGFAVRRGAFDIAEIRIIVAPELGVPRLVQRINCAVFFLKPIAEGLLTQLAVALAAVLVGQMPHDHARMAAEAAGKLLVHLLDLLAVNGRGIAVVVALAEKLTGTVCIHAAHLGIFACHPCRARAGGRSQVDGNARGIQPVDGVRHPVKVIHALFGFKGCPCKNAQRHDIDVRFFHQFDILRKDIRMVEPLVGVIVRAVAEGEISHGKSPF